MQTNRLISHCLAILLALAAASCASVATGERDTMEKTVTAFEKTLLNAVKKHEKNMDCLIGLSFSDPQRGLHVSHRGDELFHAASTMKTPVMIEMFRRAEAGDWTMADTVIVSPHFKSFLDESPYEADGKEYIQSRIGQPETLLNMTEQMMVVSDNLATNMLITMCGASKITATMRRLRVDKGYVLRCVEDIPAFENGFSNRMTPNGLTRLLEAIESGEAAGPDSTAEMRRILLAQEYNDMIPRLLPEDVKVGHKTGSIGGHRHDSAVVHAPDGPYFLTIMIAECEQANEIEDGDDPGKRATAEISRLVYDSWMALEN